MFWFGLVFKAPYRRKVSLQADWMFPSSHLLHSIECNHSSESRLTSLFLLSRSKTTFMRWTGRNTAETFLVRYIQMACVDTNAPSPLTEWSCKKSSFKPSGEFLSLGTHGRHQTFAIWTQGKAGKPLYSGSPPARGPKIISRPAFPWPSVELPTGSFIFSATSCPPSQVRQDTGYPPSSSLRRHSPETNLEPNKLRTKGINTAGCTLPPSPVFYFSYPNTKLHLWRTVRDNINNTGPHQTAALCAHRVITTSSKTQSTRWAVNHPSSIPPPGFRLSSLYHEVVSLL